MRVTVCELRNEPDGLERDWDQLIKHVKTEQSDVVLLPEMPFSPWVARTKAYEAERWRSFIDDHDRWMKRLPELSPAIVLGTRPIHRAEYRLNEGYMWDVIHGYHGVHAKHYLPDEEGFWEASWYDRGEKVFRPGQIDSAKVGFLICTEMWFTAHAIAYARENVHLLASPRATGMYSTEKWIAGGRTAAVMSGAYGLSSNRGGVDQHGFEWGGHGWIIEPEEGQLLGLTSRDEPCLTIEIDLKKAEAAKFSYPRYLYECTA